MFVSILRRLILTKLFESPTVFIISQSIWRTKIMLLSLLRCLNFSQLRPEWAEHSWYLGRLWIGVLFAQAEFCAYICILQKLEARTTGVSVSWTDFQPPFDVIILCQILRKYGGVKRVTLFINFCYLWLVGWPFSWYCKNWVIAELIFSRRGTFMVACPEPEWKKLLPTNNWTDAQQKSWQTTDSFKKFLTRRGENNSSPWILFAHWFLTSAPRCFHNQVYDLGEI